MLKFEDVYTFCENCSNLIDRFQLSDDGKSCSLCDPEDDR